MDNIQIQKNKLEFSITLKLGGREVSLTVMHRTESEDAHVAISLYSPSDEADTLSYIRYTPDAFRQLLAELSPPFWEALNSL